MYALPVYGSLVRLTVVSACVVTLSAVGKSETYLPNACCTKPADKPLCWTKAYKPLSLGILLTQSSYSKKLTSGTSDLLCRWPPVPPMTFFF